MSIRSEDLLVGLVALAMAPAIAWTIRRGLRSGRLPIGRAYVHRDERAAAFNLLLGLYALSALLMAGISADLLLHLGWREAL